MSKVTLKGNPVNTIGKLPEVGDSLKHFELIKGDLSKATLADYKGTKLVLNIFPSLDTGTCAASVRRFNKEASDLDNVKVLCISKDLPFAQSRFCGAEGIENVETLSDYATGLFGKEYGVEIIDSPLVALHSRAVIVADENGKILYTEQVPEIVDEPNYEAALEVLK